MEDALNPIDELIGKYLAGEASEEEALQVEAWENESVANKKYVGHIRFIFEKSPAVKERHSFDEDAAWTKLKSMIQRETHTIKLNKPNTENSNTLNFLLKLAASIILVLGIGYFFYQNSKPLPAFEIVASTKSLADTLPDGNNVFLNKETKLEYTYNKTKKANIVKLRGEAFFTIKHKKKQDFLVEVDGIYIRDIGTAFNVKAYPQSTKVEVFVKEGSIEFFTDTDTGVYLKAGGKGVYDKLAKKFTVEEVALNEISYKTKFFSFNNQDLGSVANDLNTVYDKQIIVSKKLKKCRLTVTFNNENIEEIASVIAETLNVSMKESGGQIILEGHGCE